MSRSAPSTSSGQRLEIADIFREYGPAYRQTHRLSAGQHRVMNAIENCRTKELGGHLYRCPECDHEQPEYNSCRNRHCPKCQRSAAERWLAGRQQELLPVPYFHVVFTLPHALNDLIRRNERQMYGLLFKAASETLLTLGRDPKHIGGEIGVIMILHTWGQNLSFHPHVHCLVPGGALSDDGKQWMWPKKSKRRKKFFVHTNVISDLFKKKFLCHLKQADRKGQLTFDEPLQPLISKLYGKKWVTDCKQPFGGPEQVLNYLGRYTHRVAISNSRLIKVEDGRIYFKWKNYRKGNRVEVMSLKVGEFVRRFLQHVLPDNFMKIRHYGILSNRHKKVKLAQCRAILGDRRPVPADETEEPVNRVCPKCGRGRLILLGEFRPKRDRTQRPP